MVNTVADRRTLRVRPVLERVQQAAFYHKPGRFPKMSLQKRYNRNMVNLTPGKAEAHSIESFQCGHCDREFQAKIITWVDVSRTPQAKLAILRWQFNIIECTHCGCRHFSGSPFFYEDFEEGLLVAVFPRIPEARGDVESSIIEKYGYYPLLEFFYDTTQIWALVYLLEHYRVSRNLRALSRIGRGEERVRKMLRFLKEDPLMITLREKLTESFFGDATDDDLADMLNQVIAALEEMHPWPLDQKCLCGADLMRSFQCCGKPVELAGHVPHLGRRYIVYCPVCKEALTGVSCEICGRVYTWNRGTVDTHLGAAPAAADRTAPPEPAI